MPVSDMGSNAEASMQFVSSSKSYAASSSYSPHHPTIDAAAAPSHAAAGISQLCSHESPESSLLDPQASPQPHLQAASLFVSKQQQQAIGAIPAATCLSNHDARQAAALVYPLPLATHEEVVSDRKLFHSTLFRLHAFLGTQIEVPKVGDKDMDLHILYCEVTARGGLEQVMKLKKWGDICVALTLSNAILSPSYFLTNHYSKLLHHYEQAYFFRTQGELVPPPGPLTLPSPTFPLMNTGRESIQPKGTLETQKKKRRRSRKRRPDCVDSSGVDPAKSIGQIVTGAIEGKFDYGYLVTVVVGSEKLRGVLYHVPPINIPPQFVSLTEFTRQAHLPLKASDLQAERIPKKKRRPRLISKKDPNAPRLNRSGYNFFFAEQRSRLKNYPSGKHTDVTKIIGELWQGLTSEERMPYIQRGEEDRERYQKEKGQYLLKIQPQRANGQGNQAFYSLLGAASKDGSDEPEQDGEQESGEGTGIEHEYHVSFETELAGGALMDHAPQHEASPQTGMLNDERVAEDHEQHYISEKGEEDSREERENASDFVHENGGHYVVQASELQQLSQYLHEQLKELEAQEAFSLET